MQSLGRAAAAFIALMVLGYIAVVAMFPRPMDVAWRPDDVGGRIAAGRLTAEAQALVARRPTTSLQ